MGVCVSVSFSASNRDYTCRFCPGAQTSEYMSEKEERERERVREGVGSSCHGCSAWYCCIFRRCRDVGERQKSVGPSAPAEQEQGGLLNPKNNNK